MAVNSSTFRAGTGRAAGTPGSAQATVSLAQDDAWLGRISGVAAWSVAGGRTGLTAAGGDETVWPIAGNFTPLAAASTFTVTYNNATDGGATTGARTLLFEYIDSAGAPAEATHVVSTTGSDVTAFTGLGINRVTVATAGTVGKNTNNITITATTGGSNQSIVQALVGVSHQATFFTGVSSAAVVRRLSINALTVSGGGSPRIAVNGWCYNRTAGTTTRVFTWDIATAIASAVSIEEPLIGVLPETAVLYFTANTDLDAAAITIIFAVNDHTG